MSFFNVLNVVGWLKGGVETPVDETNRLPVDTVANNVFSTLNSTTIPLATNGVFTGEWEDVSNFISINVLINTDRILALGGLRMEFSTDGVNTDLSRVIDITTGGDFVTFPCEAKFFRLVITNDGGPQSFLRVQTHYSASPRSLKGVPLLDNITDASTATLTRTVIEGRSSQGGGTYVPVKVAPSGSLLADVSGSTVTITQAQIDSITTILTKIDQNTDELELTSENISLNAEAINLNTDEVEAKLDTLIAGQLPDNHQVTVSNFPAIQEVTGTVSVNQPVEVTGTQLDALTDAQLRASPVEVTGSLAIEPVALQQVADDYQTGEILPDQTGANNVLTFTFATPVQNIWVYAVNPLDLAEAGEIRVDPFGGNPTSTRGIPVSYGGGFPIPVTGTSVKVFAPLGTRVTIYGNRRA